MLMMTIIRVLEGERAGRVTNFIDVIFFSEIIRPCRRIDKDIDA